MEMGIQGRADVRLHGPGVRFAWLTISGVKVNLSEPLA